ncbi:FtsB family cell division protein [Microvirga makkahensis]|uniref:Septum formation initiator family protein n=1 Tax=Microvirga makkahensis TaxID=1128670 RepID=A0A7X3SN13_9HYPH|nr:septum formation initiator family protein [Microvirga makkahensis]MXQ10922.1 septum formation initiator family protein [Microvirga makkahensis]
MVIRRRLRRFLIPLALYSVSAAVAAYFVHHAHSGARGIEAQQQYEAQMAELNRELDGLRDERTQWERRISLLRSDQIDRDLLEERARVMLGRVHKNDLVIITGP